MKKKNLITRIIAIVMCALLVLGVVTVAIYALAAGPEAAAPAPDTGSNDKIIILALVAVVALIFVPCNGRFPLLITIAMIFILGGKKDDGQGGENK